MTPPPGRIPPIADALGGRRIAITGTTGFLGTAVLERLLRSVPDCEIVLLLRAGRRSTVQQRANREIFKNDAFDALRSQLGKGFDDMLARRVTVVAGDVAMRDTDVQGVLKALRSNGINVVAIHHHMTTTQPTVYFLHYWGTGSAQKLATAVRAAIDQTGTKAAAHH